MSKTWHERFIVPPPFDPQLLPNKEDKVVVVAVVGKSCYNMHQSKASTLNMLTDKDVFLGSLHDENCNWCDIQTTCQIEGHYDAENRVVYLHLLSVYDTTMIATLCQRASQYITQVGYPAFAQTSDHMHARAMLFLFSVSHMILLYHPGSSFDVSYVRFFRILDMIRLKLQPALCETLRGIPVSKDWAMAGRPCSPRVLFMFHVPSPPDNISMHTQPDNNSKTRIQKTPPIKKLQHAIEDQIYRILRKSRIITNISNNSLFAVPANQEFVFVETKASETSDPVSFYLNQLHANCVMHKESDSTRSRGYQTNRRINQPASGSSSETSPRASPSNTESGSEGGGAHSLKQFLLQHIEVAHNKGFDDNVGRNPVPALFELPSAETWFQVCSRMHEFFLVDQVDTKARPHFNTLKSLLEIDTRFSESRCAKVLPLAEGAYQEGLPQHYTQSYHLNKVLQAKRVFLQHARGPACDKYLQQLEEDCTKIWQKGRQLCEEVSLAGNHCVNQLHRLPEFPETDENRHLPVMGHSSQVKTKATCNCGRKQAEREDPFDHKTANYEFYQKLEVGCCAKLEHYALPVFMPSTTEVKPGGAIDSSSLIKIPATHKPPVRKDSSKIDIVSGMSGLSLALSLGQSGGSDIYGNPTTTSSSNLDQSPSEIPPDAVDSDNEDDDATETESESAAVTRNGSACRQHSTTEYLPGMLHTDSPAGLLPKYSSWSLLSLGKSSLYNPQKGLEQQGFLHGSNFLLPWDVTVRGDRDKWPSVSETSTKKIKIRKAQQKDSGDLTLQVYVGIEYECPRGHRFFCSSPDKIFKVPPTGIFKENAHKVLSNDMPLYFPCHCRSSKGFMAQLMRLILVLPEGPLNTQLRPMVQPGPPPCAIFHPGTDSINLTAGLIWILRLPFVYLGENGPYRIPGDPQQVNACRLIKGFLSFSDSLPNT